MHMKKKSIAVILSGSGNRDGSEIHEATLTLWAIHKLGAGYQCYAPNIPQYNVMNHLTGEEMTEQRNVLVESARIARGKIKDLTQFQVSKHDALVLPGGLGAAKNLSNFAYNGADCKINEDVRQAIEQTVAAQKPIGALCIAPVILAKVIENATLTIGQSQEVAEKIHSMGAQHHTTLQGEVVVDKKHKLVTTPCYMLEARVDQIGESAEKLICEIIKLMA